jgi:hypothetical protein
MFPPLVRGLALSSATVFLDVTGVDDLLGHVPQLDVCDHPASDARRTVMETEHRPRAHHEG